MMKSLIGQLQHLIAEAECNAQFSDIDIGGPAAGSAIPQAPKPLSLDQQRTLSQKIS